jgi:hypothetical protein
LGILSLIIGSEAKDRIFFQKHLRRKHEQDEADSVKQMFLCTPVEVQLNAFVGDAVNGDVMSGDDVIGDDEIDFMPELSDGDSEDGGSQPFISNNDNITYATSEDLRYL